MADKNGPFDDFEIEHSKGLPIWIQLRNRLAYLIGAEVYAEGDQLPTVRQLALDLDIAYNTVNRAYMDLEREGYITTRRGRGSFVAPRRAVGCARLSDSPVELVVDDMIRVCRDSGLADTDIVSLVEERVSRRILPE